MTIRQRAMALLLCSALCASIASIALADPCLVVYPTGVTFYHYDPAEHYTVTSGDALYDPAYDRGGEVLIDVNTNEISLNIYQAPNLDGFVQDTTDQGYFFEGNEFDLVIDGFNNKVTTFVNVLLVANQLPSSCPPQILVDGVPMSEEVGLGFYLPMGDLPVSTPAQGNNYSDTMTVHVSWNSCAEIAFYAFSDENFNLVRNGGECFSAFSHDTTVPVLPTSWGDVKGRFGGQR